MKYFQSTFFGSFLLLLLTWFTLTSNALDIYIDSNPAASLPPGAQGYLFKSLKEALSVFPSQADPRTSGTPIRIFVKPNAIPYPSTNTPQVNFNGLNATSLTMTIWGDSNPVNTIEDCNNLPRIDASTLNLKYNFMKEVIITDVCLVNLGGSITVNSSQTLTIKNVCIDDSESHSTNFLRVQDVPNVTLQNIWTTLADGRSIINYQNTKPDTLAANAVLQDLHIRVVSATPTNLRKTYFRFIVGNNLHQERRHVQNGWGKHQELIVERVTMEALSSDLVMPVVALAMGWDKTKLDVLSIQDQIFSVTDNGVMQLVNIRELAIENANIANNIIYAHKHEGTAGNTLFLFLRNITELNLFNNVFTANQVYGSNNALSFRLIEVETIDLFILKNYTVNLNTFYITAQILRLDTQTADDPADFVLGEITLEDNYASAGSIFYFLMFSQSALETFSMQNLKITNNTITGRIFHFETVGNANMSNPDSPEISLVPSFLNFTNVFMDSNSNLTNVILLFFSTTNPSSIPSEYVAASEYYSIAIRDFTLSNNNFYKGKSTDWLDQFSLIQSTGAQVYIEDAKVINNSFIHYDFLSLDQQISSVFLVNSTVENNLFENGNMIITRYEAITVTRGPFSNTADGSVLPMYRYAFVTESEFKNITLINSSLFTLNNAFLIFVKNNFRYLNFTNSLLLTGGKFRPPALDLADFVFQRDYYVEQTSLAVNPYLLDLYLEVRGDMIPMSPPTVYFYTIRSNTLKNFNISSKAIISFQDYQFQQGIITLKYNSFENFHIYNNLANLISLQQASKAFRFHKNNITSLKGVGTVLRLGLLEDNKLCLITNNIVQRFKGPSFLSASGGSITNITISNNIIQNNRFWSSTIQIDLTMNDGNIFTSNNTFYNNLLKFDNHNLYSKLSFVSITAEAASEQQTLVFDNWLFVNNTYENLKTFSQYVQLSAGISLLLANSSVVIQNSEFYGTEINSKGNSLFYIAAEYVKFENSSINTTVLTEGLSVFHLMVLKADFIDNKFVDIEAVNGKGMIYMGTRPFLSESTTLKLEKNSFSSIAGGSGNVLCVENTDIVLYAAQNGFTDCMDTNAAIHFKSSKCVDCYILNSTFIVSPEGADENHFYQIDGLSGNLVIENSYIQYFNDDDDPDIFFTCTDSPKGNMTIINLSWSERSNKNPLQIANMNSGNLTIMDTELSDFTYTMRKAAGYVIQATAGPDNLISSAINLKNVKLSNMVFIRPFQSEKFKVGAIAFMGNAPVKSYLWKVNIENCTFDSIVNASVLYVQMPAMYNIKIRDSFFQNAVNAYAPALNYFTTANANSQVSIINNTFTNNMAYRAAGAISLSACNYTITNNTFIDNYAEYLGGAVLLQSSIRTQNFYNDNSFINNRAEVGNDVASTLSRIKMDLILPKESNMYIDRQVSRVGAITIKNGSSSHISKIGMRITFWDRDMQPTLDFGSDKPSIVVSFGKQSTLTSFNCSWSECNIDRFNVTLSGLAGDIIPVYVYYYSAPQTNGQGGLLQTFNIQLRKCIEGEYNNTNTRTCDYCQEGSYSLNPMDSCQDCPSEAICLGGSVLLPQKGFWREGQWTSNFLTCRNDGIERCESRKCRDGYTGHRCEACDFDKNYIETGLLRCGQCEDVWLSLLLGAGAFLLYLFYKIFCIWRLYATNESFCADRGLDYATYRASESGYYVKLLLVYTHVLSLVYLFNMEVREFVGSLSQIGNPSTFILMNLQCSLIALGVKAEQLIYTSTIILVISPFVQCFLVFLLTQTILRRAFRKMKLKAFTILSVLYIMIVEQPGIVGYLTAFMSCSKGRLNENSEYSFIALHPNWSCEDPSYQYYKSFFVVPSLIFWSLVLPVAIFLILFIQRRSLDTLSTRMAWGSLYNINKREYYYWGTIVMIMELIISFASYAFQADLKARVFTMFILLWSYQFAVRQMKPYRYAKFNSMESLTFSLLMLNIILGYYAIDNNYPILKYGAYVILAVLNLTMTLFLAWKLFDITVMRVFDMSIEKFNYLMRGRRDNDESRDRMLSIESYSDLDGGRSRTTSLAESEYPERRTSYAHMKIDEDFVL